MKRIFESAGTSLNDATPELAAWISAQVAMIATHCASDERPQLRAYRCGHEYLAYDYPSLPLTIRIDAAAKPPGSEALDQDIAVCDMTDALTLISLIEGARQGMREPAITLGTYLPGSCVQQPVAAAITERAVTMTAIRMLAQTSEALCSEMEMGNDAAIGRNILPVARMCSDHAEHIAQYDVEGLDLATRMRSIAESLNVLRHVLANCHEVLKNTSSHVPDTAEIESLIARAEQLGAGAQRETMILETAQSILINLTQSQRELLERSHWRYMAFAHVILDDEFAKQAEADREAYPHLLKFSEDHQSIVSAQRAAEFMAAVSGLPVEWCEAWDAHDFYEAHGVSLEQAELDGHV